MARAECPFCGALPETCVSHSCGRFREDARFVYVVGYLQLTFIVCTEDLEEGEIPGSVRVGWFPNRHLPRKSLTSHLTRDYFERLEEMKRYNQEGQKKAGKFTPSKDKFLAGRPNLDAMLNDAWWDDGKPRETCSLTIRTGTDRAMVSLNDSEAEQSISTNGEDVTDALDRLEAYLASGNPTWRSWGKRKR